MLIVAVLGIFIAFLRPSLISMFFIIGVVRASGFFPTIISLFIRGIPALAIPIAIFGTIVIGLPLSIYANYVGNPVLNTTASLGSIILPLLICLAGKYIVVLRRRKKYPTDYIDGDISDIQKSA